MKKLVSIVLICLCNLGFAQKGRIAIIDSDFILSKMPEYQEANNELKKRAAEWDLVIERKKKEIKDLKDQLAVERPLLTQQLIDEKEEDIAIIQKELSEFQQEKYNSQDGDYFRQKLALAKPLQDQINTIVEEIAERKRYTTVIDKAVGSETALMYINKSDEISDQVLRKLELSRNKSKLSKKEIAQIEEMERVQEVKDRQRTKRDELIDRQRRIEQEKEEAQQQAALDPAPPIPQETELEKRKREQLEKIEAAKAERERLRQEKLEELAKKKEELAQKRKEALEAAQKAREDALKKRQDALNGISSSPSGLSEKDAQRIEQLKAKQAQRQKEIEDRKAKALQERQQKIAERKKQLEEAKEKRLKEIEDRKKSLENKK